MAARRCRVVFIPGGARQLIQSPTQSLFLGAIPPALAVVLNGFAVFLVNWWDPERVMHTAEALWWIDAALALACTLVLPFFMFIKRAIKRPERITALLILPVLPCVVASGTGGILANRADLGAVPPAAC
jgi:tellurite resistance protein TehA-like permease